MIREIYIYNNNKKYKKKKKFFVWNIYLLFKLVTTLFFSLEELICLHIHSAMQYEFVCKKHSRGLHLHSAQVYLLIDTQFSLNSATKTYL